MIAAGPPTVIVPDLTISPSGSSCNYLFFGLILASLLSLSTYWDPIGRMGCKELEGEIKKN